MDTNYSIVIPTCRRPENLKDHIDWLLDMEPNPNKILVVHPKNKFTSKFDWKWIAWRKNVDCLLLDEDPGLLECKYRFAYDILDDDFVFVCDDDIFPGKRYPKNFFLSYDKKPGIYGGIGFHFGEDHFEGSVYGGTYDFPNYHKEHKITLVDAPGQSFFFNKEDIPYVSENSFPEWMCRFCSDDIKLSWWADRVGVDCYVVPHGPKKSHDASVYELRELDLDTQSLVRGGHPDSQHKNEFIFNHMIPNGYTRVRER